MAKQSILLGLFVDTGWLAHHSTRLVNTPGAMHCHAATIAALCGCPPSTRKPWTVGTSQCAWQDARYWPRGAWMAARRCPPPVGARLVCRRGRRSRAAFQLAARSGNWPTAVVGQARRRAPNSVVLRLNGCRQVRLARHTKHSPLLSPASPRVTGSPSAEPIESPGGSFW